MPSTDQPFSSADETPALLAPASECQPADTLVSVQRLQEGGQEELTQLFMRVRHHLRNMIETRLDRRLHSRVDASDIVQETFVRASQSLESYLKAPRMDPVVWLRLIGKHAVAEVHRKHFRDKRTPNREHAWSEDEPLIQLLADSVRSVGSAAQFQELVQMVRTKIRMLAQNDREVLEMRHIEGLSMQETAHSLEIGLETAKKRYTRALQRFREIAADLVDRPSQA